MSKGVTYITRDGDCLDLICFKHYGRSSGIVEKVLEANHGLAELGPVYPEQVSIFLPEIAKPTVSNVINIWD